MIITHHGQKNSENYFRIAAGNPNLFVPKDVSKMKCPTFAVVAASKEEATFKTIVWF